MALAPDLAPACPNCRHPLLLPEKQFKSPVPHLYQSFDCPTNLERAPIQEALSDAQREIERLDSEMLRTTLMLTHLHSQRRNVQTFVANHKALLAPIQSLPVELLSKIFELCLPEPSKIDCHYMLDAPLLLAQINRRWRYVALSTPKLWTTIKMPFGMGDSAHEASLMQTWVKRSGQLPLSLTVQRRWEESDCDPVLNAIIPHSERWNFVSFTQVFQGKFATLAPVRGRLPMLESLEILESETDDYLFRIFELAPRLTTMRSLRLPPPSWRPWHQLTTWKGVKMSVRECVVVLRYAPNLVSCDFPTVMISRDGIPIPPPPPHKSLASLSVPAHCSSSLLPHLTLPNLQTLSILGGWAGNIISPNMYIYPFLTQSPHLQTLVLTAWINSGDLARLLSDAPFLTNLQIKGISYGTIDDEILKWLTCDPDNTISYQVPHLTTIVFEGNYRFSPRALISMVLSRWQRPGVARLQSVRLVSCDGIMDIEGINVGVQTFKERGLSFSIAYNPKVGG